MRPKQGMAVPQDGRFRARLENMVDPRRHPPLLQHAAVLIERRRRRYKIGRLHSVLRYRPPARAGSGLVAPDRACLRCPPLRPAGRAETWASSPRIHGSHCGARPRFELSSFCRTELFSLEAIT